MVHYDLSCLPPSSHCKRIVLRMGLYVICTVNTHILQYNWQVAIALYLGHVLNILKNLVPDFPLCFYVCTSDVNGNEVPIFHAVGLFVLRTESV